MIDLDDVSAVRAADPGGMLDAVGAMPTHCEEGYGAAKEVAGIPSADGVSALAYCGMGGSAVAGDVVRVLFRDRLGLPVEVVRSPELPEYCGPHTLVVCASYSGATAETLSCYEEATHRGCRVVVVASGGELAARALESGLGVVRVPAGFQPRAALGYLAFASLGALEATGILPSLAGQLEETAGELGRLSASMGPDVPLAENPAKDLAVRVRGRVPVVWGAEGIGAVAASRWKTQMNENAKVPAFSSALPELDHNEVVGWSADAGRGFYIVALRTEGDRQDLAARFAPSLEIAQRSGASASEVWGSGRSPLSQLFSLVLLGDFVSVYLALLRGIDPTPVDAIDHLKQVIAGG